MVSSPVDTRNFDYFPFDDDIPPDELSGWDEVCLFNKKKNYNEVTKE